MWTVVAALVGSMTLAAQTEEVRVSSRPYVPFRLRVESNLVQVNVVVRDRAGHAVSGLKQADFRLLEEGKPREISSFAVESRPAAGGSASVASTAADGRPVRATRWIALYFDDLGTGSAELVFTKSGAKKFVEEGLDPADRVAVFASSTGRMTDFTADRAALTAAIDKVQTHARFAQNATLACPRITPYDAYKIAILKDDDAIHSAIAEMSICGLGMPTAPATPRVLGRPNQTSPERNLILNQAEQIWTQVRVISQNTMDALDRTIGELSRLQGSRMLLLVSSGFVTSTLEREQDVLVNEALRSGVVINSLDAKGLFAEAPGRPFGEDQGAAGVAPEVFAQETMNAVDRKEQPSSVLASLSASTGGMFFHHNNGFTQGFRELGSVPETSYLLGFRPDESELDGKYHKLKVRLENNSYGVQSRPGFVAVAMAATVATGDNGRSELERQVTGSDVVKGLAAVVEAQAGVKAANGMTPLHVKMHVDLKGVEFPERNGRRVQKLTFVFALLDKDNTIVAAREGVMDFALTEAKFGSMMESGVNAVLTIEAPSGVYRLRTVAIEGVKSKMAGLSYAVKF